MLKIIFNTVLGVVLILIWLRFVDLAEIFMTISRLNPINLVPVFIFMLLSPMIRAVRFKIFLSEVKKIPLLDLIFLNIAAIMLNFFIPIRAGEIAKGIYLNTRFGLKLGKSIIWVFLDRFVDFLVVLLIGTILIVIIPTALPKSTIFILASLLSSALILTYLAVFQLSFAKKLVIFLKYILIEKHIKIYFVRITSFILESFAILNRHPKDLLLLGLITILAYGADAAIWYFTFRALGSSFDFLIMYLGQLLSALTYLIPAAPGYIGSAEASGVLILSGIFGISINLASAMIVLFHLTTAIFILIFGLISIFWLKIDIGAVLKKALKRG